MATESAQEDRSTRIAIMLETLLFLGNALN